MNIQKMMAIFVFGLLLSPSLLAGPEAKYWKYWDVSNEKNFRTIDHGDWDSVLQQYVVTNHPSGINRFRYGDVSSGDRKRLRSYIDTMGAVDPRIYRKREQEAFWLNLYNALMVDLILNHYPIKSINDIKGKGLSDGPWESHLVTVAKKKLSLNDIEHRILRPLWKDYKVLFGLACGSLDCPSLQDQSFTAQNLSKLLKKTGHEFVNHERGVSFKKGKLTASRIFDLYGEDAEKIRKDMLKLFAFYSEDRQALYLLGFSGDIKYRHDWTLNAP